MNSAPFMIRQVIGSMRIPLQLGPDSILYHAIPRPAYSRFESQDEADSAITRTIEATKRRLKGFEFTPGEFEIIPVADYEGALEASEKQKQKRQAAKKKKAPAEEEVESA